MIETRASGILLPVFSLPSDCGLGELYPETYKFIDKLHEAGQRFWQVLPIGPVNEELCPYQSASGFAGEPLMISLKRLVEKGLLDEASVAKAAYTAHGPAEGTALAEELLQKKALLRKAYGAFCEKISEDEEAQLHFSAFCRMEEDWLRDYALFSALADYYGDTNWFAWEEEIRDRRPEAMARWSEELSRETAFYCWTQYEFFDQWDGLKRYAHEKGVELIGDIPYYTAYESADCWANPSLFRLDDEGGQAFEAGAPPDAFTAEGQCWGNPVYDWQAHKEQGFDWWIRRLRQQLRFFDVVRLDHMRGFESYFAIPSDTEKPADGHWEKGPGMELFDAVRASLGECRFIAEDLGYLTEEVRDMMTAAGFPGMKILQFAFDTGEENVYLPMNYETDNSVIYTGTHDNDTSLGWYEKAEDWKKRFVSWYLREKAEFKNTAPDDAGAADEIMEPEAAVAGLIELAHSSRCRLCVIPMQDYLMLGSEARLNVPGVAEGNWRWQMEPDAFSPELAKSIAGMTARWGR